MLNGLKGLFSYKEPPKNEGGFRFPEDPSESAAWDQYRGKESNLESRDHDGNKREDAQNQDNSKETQDGQQEKDQELTQDSKAQNEMKNSQGQESENTEDQEKSEENNKDQKNKKGQDSKKEQDKTKEDKQDPQNKGDQGETQGSKNTQESQNTQEGENNQKGQNQQDDKSAQENEDNLKNKEEKNNKEAKKESDENNDEQTEKDSGEDKKDKLKTPRVIIPLSVEELVKSKNQDDKKKENGKEAKDKQDRREKKNKKSESKNSDEGKNKDGNGKGKEDSENKQKSDNCNEGKGQSNEKEEKGGQGKSSLEKENDKSVYNCLDENIRYLKKIFHLPVNQDVIIREFNVARKIPACMVFIDGMVDRSIIVQFSLPQLMDVHPFKDFEGGCPLDYIEENVLSINQIARMSKFKEIIPQILSGLTALFIDGCEECLIMESRGYEKRNVTMPFTETVVQGAQEGFTENLRTNITLVRRIVKNENLITEFRSTSKTNNFMSAILYMEGLTNPKIVDEVKRRVESLDVDFISGSGMLEQLIEDKTLMLFPQVISTERPDRVASFLLEGKVVLICEGTPFALAMPITFFDLFHTTEESNLRWQYGTFLRIVRLLGALLAAFLPGVWTALILFHQEMIPTPLLASIVASRAPVPFPFIIEFLLMELSFELIREGGIRVPGISGNTLGIIGALILGQSAVSAGIVSPSLIIIVAVSGLGNFAIPNYSLALAVRIFRFIFIAFGALAGLYGISIGFTLLCAFTLSMKSFGVPFFTPLSPETKTNQDKILRGPLPHQTRRLDYLNTQDEKRMGDHPRGWTVQRSGGRQE